MNGDLVSFRVFMVSFEPPAPVSPAPGVRVCELETDNCAVTEAGGTAMLEASEGEIALSTDEGGLDPHIYPAILSPGGPLFTLSSGTLAHVEEMFALMDSQYPQQGPGGIWVGRMPQGAMLTLLNGTGKPFYADDDAKQSWSPDLTATTSTGGGGFLEVAPGEYQVEVSGTSGSCTPARGWPGDSENTVRVPVREGYISHTVMKCD